ncbi:MAG: hydroxysqualene dehydroxylase HpnE [Planctomycetaceae bacterium]|nr:hydroxysqualene dehydroxylase HpnE [Planctomycetaceae bacterium]
MLEATAQPGSSRTIIVGGGLAGMAAAKTLSQCGRAVTLLESRQQLGGRASSFVDHETGTTIDNCQHVAMGCCRRFLAFCRETGIADEFQREQSLTFLAPGHRPSRFAASWLPAPLHLASAFARLPYLSCGEKLRFAVGVRSLWASDPAVLRGQSFRDWLTARRQSESLQRKVWEVLLISALSESLDRIDAAYARQVLVDGFLTSRDGWQVYRPLKSLGELWTQRVGTWLREQGVDIRLGQGVSQIERGDDGGFRVRLRDDTTWIAESVILAVPWHRVEDLLAPELSGAVNLKDLGRMEAAPITSVHLWVDRRLMPQEHLVLVDQLSQWLFLQPEQRVAHVEPIPMASLKTEEESLWHYQVVISASRMLKGITRDEVIAQVWQELQSLLPDAAQVELRHARVVTEHRAVFSPTPGIDELRPSQRTAIPALYLAGDWTQTDWPATMEGAIISGEQAAQACLIEDRGLRTDTSP